MNADFNPRRLERYLAAGRQSGATPVVVLTKADLAVDDQPARYLAQAQAVAFGAPVLPVSAVTGEGMTALSAWLASGETSVLVGSSGVGKSSLVNAMAGSTLMATSHIREDDARGRHTTTHRELIRLPSGHLILDTPGMRELGLMDANNGLAATFEDVEALVAACRFSDCSHRTEPGCAVQAALKTGALEPQRLKSFVKLQRELDYQRMKDDPEAREAHRREWRTINKAQRARRKLDSKR
jgi:ribosome biogenesis GTPase